MPEGQFNIVCLLLGMLGSGFFIVLGYFFGSGKGIADKPASPAEKTEPSSV